MLNSCLFPDANNGSKIVFQERAVLVVRIDRFVAGRDFQVGRLFNVKVDISAPAANVRQEGDFLLEAMVLADDHDEFEVAARPQPDFPFDDTLVTAFGTLVGLAGHCGSPEESPRYQREISFPSGSGEVRFFNRVYHIKTRHDTGAAAIDQLAAATLAGSSTAGLTPCLGSWFIIL